MSPALSGHCTDYRKQIFVFIFLFFTSLGLVAIFLNDRSDFLPVDLLQYWSAAIRFNDHLNPYDYLGLFKLQKTVSNSVVPVMIWNPPIILGLIFWMGFFSFETLTLIVLALSVVIYVYCLVKLKFLNLTRINQILFILFVLLHPGFRAQLQYGQITWMLILAVLLWFASWKKNNLLTGVALALTLIKPHLFIPLYLYTLFSCKINKIFLLILPTLVLLIALSIYQPGLWSYYYEAFLVPPNQLWFSASLASNIYNYYGISFYYIIPILGLLWLFTKTKLNSELLFAQLIITGLCFAPYLWAFDQILLIPAVLISLQYLNSKTASIYLVCLIVLSFLTILSVSFDQEYWYVPVVFILNNFIFQASYSEPPQ